MKRPAVDEVLDAVYAWSRKRDYKGYNKHDGLNSPILKALLGWGKWPGIFGIQMVMRAPFNLRPYLLVKPAYNPKGLALFTLGLIDRFRETEKEAYLKEACELLELLQNLQSRTSGDSIAWGYHYPWFDPGFAVSPGTPNAVVSSFVCEAFLEAYRVTKNDRYLRTVSQTIKFFDRQLIKLKDTQDELCLSYMPLPMTMRVMDVSILVGSVMAQYSAITGEDRRSESAYRLVNYVVKQQTDYGAWFYTDPSSDSRIRHDNYHTGFILDALWRYMESTDNWEWRPQYDAGMDFYRQNLFSSDGAPRWMSDTEFPHDIHGAAQGIITFSRHWSDDAQLVNSIAGWALDTMYDPEGRFFYQQRKHYRIRYTLMRWCNAWMARALAAMSLAEYRHRQSKVSVR